MHKHGQLARMNLPTDRKKVIVITTGGTIEKTYDEGDGSLINRGTIIKNFLEKKLRLPSTDLEVRSIMSMDSLYMTDKERTEIATAISEAAVEGCPVLVLHGTDTMEITAKHCHKTIASIQVPVIFTGAMRPIGFEDSDAVQNVTEALAFAKVLPEGFYISFHNQIFLAHRASKDHQYLTFKEF